MLLLTPSDWPTLQHMLESIASNIPRLNILVSAFAYLTGLLYMLKGTYALKEYGELRTMMSSQTSLIKPMTKYMIGTVLLFFPSTYHYAIQTVFGQANPTLYAYRSSAYNSWHGIIAVVIQIIQFLGIIAFIRGVLLLSHLGGQQAPQGATGKAATHLIGGVLAMNIVGFSHVIESTIGITISG